MNARENRRLARALPPRLAELVERWGGIRLYVPLEQNIDEAHPIAQELGLEAARKLARLRNSGGQAYESLEVPHAAAYLRALRDRLVKEAFAESSAARVARRFGMTRRNVFNVLKREEPEAPPQSDLFNPGTER